MGFESILILIVVLIAGGLGSVIRYLLASFAGKLPWGILIANVAGSAVIGFAFVMSTAYATFGIFGAVVATILATGFAGGLTTFSSWAAQTAGLAKGVSVKLAVLNGVLNIVGSAFAVFIGMFLANALIK